MVMLMDHTPATAYVSAALTRTQVEVTSSYNGETIVLYGAVFSPKDKPSDVVIVVHGPDQPLRIARKVQIAGLWLSHRPVVFEGAPSFYTVSSARPLLAIAAPEVLQRHGIGIDHLTFQSPQASPGTQPAKPSAQGRGIRERDYQDYRQAVVRLKQAEGLYEQNEAGLRFVDKGLFRAQIALPSTAPIGLYEAKIYLFQDGRPIQMQRRMLNVQKVGLERAVYVFAHTRPWTYGIIAVLFAVATGYGASVIFRRS
jgi:uncharacterized protein (TIGR02186 family)